MVNKIGYYKFLHFKVGDTLVKITDDQVEETVTITNIDYDGNVIEVVDVFGNRRSVDPNDYEYKSDIDAEITAWDLHKSIAQEFEHTIKRLRETEELKDYRIKLSVNTTNLPDDKTLTLKFGVQIDFEEMIHSNNMKRSAMIARKRFLENYHLSIDMDNEKHTISTEA